MSHLSQIHSTSSTSYVFRTSFKPFNWRLTLIAFMIMLLHGYFTLLVKQTIGFSLSARTWPTSSRLSCQREKLTSYCRVVKHLRHTYATDDKIYKADANITNYKQPPNLNIVDYAQLLWTKSVRRSLVYDGYGLEGTFIEGLGSSIWQSMRSNWAKNKGVPLRILARLAVSLTILQSRSSLSENWKPKRNRDHY